ncbi:MAG: hypothetical protein Q8868_07025 [Bacteroidota bacterium]|nr:hypothetical protein [Bacteroidota bacterium]
MSKKALLFLAFISVLQIPSPAQVAFATADLMHRNDNNSREGKVIIEQDPRIDSLLNRNILYNKRLNGMEGFRIQVFNSSDKNAREASGKVRAEFISKFPDIVSYASFERPGYYKIRAGDYRTRVEGTKYLLMVRKVFPDAYLVPDIINFPDLNKK